MTDLKLVNPTVILEHRIEFRPAFDKRSDVQNENYGIHGMEIAFYVIGPKGAIQWVIYTNWHVRSAREHLKGFPRLSFDDRCAHRPEGYDLGYHAREPQYDGQTPMRGDCCVIGGRCFYDGSGLQATLPIEGFLSGGEDWLWPKLEAAYRHRFEGAEWPFTDEAADCRAHGEFV